MAERTVDTMRIGRNLAVVIGLVGALVACGDDSSPDSSGDVTVRLLSAGDLGPAWREAHEVGEADFDDAWQIPCDDAAMNPTMVDTLRPSAGAQFEPTDGSRRHLIELVTLGAEDDLANALDAYVGAVGSCPTESTWGGASVSVTALDLGALGDQRAAFTTVATLSGGADSAVWHTRNASVRVGSHIVSVGLTEILDRGEPQPAVTDMEFVGMVRAAVSTSTGSG